MPILILLITVLCACCHSSSSGGTIPDAVPMSRDAEASKRDGDTPRTEAGPRDGAISDREASTPTPPLKPPAHTFVYIGGWSNCGASYPFRAFSLDRTTGALTVLGDADLGRQPSMIARSRDGRFLYVGNECGGAEGGVTVASINRDTGALTPLRPVRRRLPRTGGLWMLD